jgi:serine/threonine protein kinase
VARSRACVIHSGRASSCSFGKRPYRSQDIGARPARPFHALPVDEQRRLLSELANLTSTVGALHAEGVVHRDLTPSNIRIAGNGTVFLLDLELAHVIGGEAPPFSQGTPGFMSPQ